MSFPVSFSLLLLQKDNKEHVKQRTELSSSLDKSRKHNRDLMNKMKDLQFQLQGLVDKLRKEKKKVSDSDDNISPDIYMDKRG